MTVKLIQQEFITRCISKHGSEKYDYSTTVYKTAKEKVEIYCNTCKEFFYQIAFDHASNGRGCPKCGLIKRCDNQRTSLDDFIRRSEEVHGIGTNDYSEVLYKNNQNKVRIRCNSHNHWYEQSPSNHLIGKAGCKFCEAEKISSANSSTAEIFIDKAKRLFGERFDYSEVVYKNSATKVKILCRKHSEYFYQKPNGHLSGREGCVICQAERGMGFQKAKPAVLYVHHIVGIQHEFTGYGITMDVARRNTSHSRNLSREGYSINNSFITEKLSGEFVHQVENAIRNHFPLDTNTSHIEGFKRESTTTPYQTVVAFVEERIKDYIAKNK